MNIDRFHGGSPSARDKLNHMLEETNALAGLRNDGQFPPLATSGRSGRRQSPASRARRTAASATRSLA